MAKDQSQRVIRFTDDALLDLAGINTATLQQWGKPQAERYVKALETIFDGLAEDPLLGEPLNGWSNYFVFTAKYRKRRNAHGHRIFYRKIENGIRVIRVLHTAMHWPPHLNEEKI